MERPVSVAFIGTGLMGTPMIRRLLGAGFTVRVWNRTASKVDPLATAGAIRASTIAEACDGAATVCTCLTNAEAVEQAVFGTTGVVDAARAPSMLVDFSTIGPTATEDFAARLLRKRGVTWVDAPVSGGPTGAAAGKLVIFCGGSAVDVERARPVFDAMAQRVTHFGAVGTGQAAKVCNQVIVAVTVAAIAESLSLAEAMSLDSLKLVEALTGGYADSIPLQIFGRRMAQRSFEPKLGDLSLMAKDLALASEIASRHGAPPPVLTAALGVYASAPGRGLAGADLGELIKLQFTANAGAAR